MGYILGKAEGEKKLWHGHVTAVTVSPEFRKLGIARSLMNHLECVSESVYNGYFVDLFVRASNALAIKMYENLGYSVYRRVLGYYSGEEDAFGKISSFIHQLYTSTSNYYFLSCEDMRKPLPRDTTKESIIPLAAPITPDQLEW
jgi:N-terminal acetyltransferase B complex catalytic subunit